MWFKILSSRNNNSWSLPLPAQDLQPLHVRGIPLLQCSCKCCPYFTLPPQGLQTKMPACVQESISMSGETRLQLSISSAENKASFKLHRHTPLLPSPGEKQTKMCSCNECPKITWLLASQTSCPVPWPNCNRGKTNSRYERQPVQTGKWTRANYPLRYHLSHKTEAHNWAIWEGLMQAGAGFNEHRVSHQILQKRTAGGRANNT